MRDGGRRPYAAQSSMGGAREGRGGRQELLDAIYGLCRFFWAKGELIHARELGDKLEAMARRGGDPIRMMAAHAAYGSVLATRGETAAAMPVLRDGLCLAKRHWRDDLISVYGGDLEAVCAGTLANMLLVTGYEVPRVRRRAVGVSYAGSSVPRVWSVTTDGRKP